MSTIAYQCLCCGAPLVYAAQSGKLECSACGNSYELDALEAIYESPETGSIQFDMHSDTFDADEASQMRSYICQGCGAELLTEETTTATDCPYCGSPTVLPEHIAEGVKPELVIPFFITKEQAQEQFENYFKGKALLPNVFLNTRNRIAEMRKLYVPYWLFDCRASGSTAYKAEKKYVRREGEWEVTYTEHYFVTRAGMMDFHAIPVDGSKKLDNKITESLEPYDLSAAVPFVPAVLAGAMADRADVDSVDCEERACQRVESSMEHALRNTVTGYTSVTQQNKGFHTEEGKVTPVLMPVWLITTEKEGTTYTFAINGQTGKLTCDVPTDTKKSLMWGLGVFAGVFAFSCILLYAGSILESGMLFMASILALIAGAGTVGVLSSQLKQATSVHSAGDYILRDSFVLHNCKDYYTHTTQTRRRIEQGPPQNIQQRSIHSEGIRSQRPPLQRHPQRPMPRPVHRPPRHRM